VADAATVRWAGANVKVAPLTLGSPKRTSFPFLGQNPLIETTVAVTLSGELLDPLSDYIAGLPTPQQRAMREYFSSRRPSASFSPNELSYRDIPSKLTNSTSTTPDQEFTHPMSSSNSSRLHLDQQHAPLNQPTFTMLQNLTLLDGALAPSIDQGSCKILSIGSSTNHDLNRREGEQSSPDDKTPGPSGYNTLNQTTPTNSSPATPFSTVTPETTPSRAVPSEPRCYNRTNFSNTSKKFFNSRSSQATSPHETHPHNRAYKPSGQAMTPAEESSFEELGYLVAPRPPNEIQRQTALHKFNILHTAPDVNFDRIAHLAKLVFRARWVFIILVDKDLL
jgi:hypothetical protein